MDEQTAARLAARLDEIDRKLDEVLAFRDQVLSFAAGKIAGKVLAHKVKRSGE